MIVEIVGTSLFSELTFGLDHGKSVLVSTHLLGGLVGHTFSDAKSATDAVHG